MDAQRSTWSRENRPRQSLLQTLRCYRRGFQSIIWHSKQLCRRSSCFHFDLYRLEDPSELREIGLEDYIDSGNPVFIEWPEIIEAALEEEGFLPVRVIVMDNQDRIFNLGK